MRWSRRLRALRHDGNISTGNDWASINSPDLWSIVVNICLILNDGLWSQVK